MIFLEVTLYSPICVVAYVRNTVNLDVRLVTIMFTAQLFIIELGTKRENNGNNDRIKIQKEKPTQMPKYVEFMKEFLVY